MRSNITLRLEHRSARKLLIALEKGVYDKLTPAQADELSEFIFNLRCSVMEEEVTERWAKKVGL